jgi:ligand-binding SRPBCC domain-containing protein
LILHRFETIQDLQAPLEAAWRFFSDPRNLPSITPPWLGFEVRSPLPDRIRPGLLIEYRVRPIAGLPVRWITRIGAVEEPRRFIDEQLAGPYRFWQHEHLLAPSSGGTVVRDIVHYSLPFGPLGGLVHPLLVRPRLEAIFAYRREALARRFPGRPRERSGGS